MMKIAVEKATGRVVYYGVLSQDERGILGDGFTDPRMTAEVCDLIALSSGFPIPWVPGHWYWNGASCVLSAEGISIVSGKNAKDLRDDKKARRNEAVERITVTTQAGNTFDGDEESQTRLDRAASTLDWLTARLAAGNPVALPPAAEAIHRVVDGVYEMIWILADNSTAFIGAEEMREAKALAGAQQAILWPIEV